MKIYYSKSTGGFYNSDVNDSIPAGAVEITEELHQSLLIAQSNGASIKADENGYPFATSPPKGMEFPVWTESGWVTDADRKALYDAEQQKAAEKSAVIFDSLPTRAAVLEWINEAFPDKKQSDVMGKLVKVIYLLAKNEIN